MFVTIDEGAWNGRTQQAVDAAPQLVLFLLALVSGLALLATLYRTRSRVRALGVGAAGLVVAWAVASAWPWGGLAPRLEDASWATAHGAGALAVDTASLTVADRAGYMGRTRRRAVRAGVVLEGLPPGWSARVGLVEATLRIEGRGALASAPAGSVALAAGERNSIHEAVAQVLGVGRLADSSPRMSEAPVVLNLRESEARAWAPAAGAYRGLFEVVPVKHAIEARLPLLAGAVHQRGAYRLVIAKVEYGTGEIAIEARESDAVNGLGPPPDRSYYLRNARRSEAVEGSIETPAVMSFPLPFGIAVGGGASGFVAKRVTIEFPSRQAPLNASLPIDQRWLDGAELVIVSATQAKAFDRRLEIPAFPLKLGDTATAQTSP